MSDFSITTPTGEKGHKTHPTGHVTTNGKGSTIDLPTRTTGPDSQPEVTYDHNADLPERS